MHLRERPDRVWNELLYAGSGMRQRNLFRSHADRDVYSNGDRDCYVNANCDVDQHRDEYAHGNRHRHADPNGNQHGDKYADPDRN